MKPVAESQVEELTAQIKAAVASEDYELAAELKKQKNAALKNQKHDKDAEEGKNLVVQVPEDVMGAILGGAKANETEKQRTLVGQDGFVPAWTDKSDSRLLLLDLQNLVGKNKRGPLNVLASATWAKGTFQEDVGQVTTLHEPVDGTQDTMISFDLSESDTIIDVKRPTTSLRTTDWQAKTALKKGAWNGWAYSLQRLDGTLIGLPEDTVLVDGSRFIQMGFFCAGWGVGGAISNYRIVSAKSYWNNILVTVKLQIATGAGVIPVDVSFSLVGLPQEPMKHRVSDDRLGYFTTSYLDIGQQNVEGESIVDRADKQVNVINRFNVSATWNKEIRFYVDPTVPERWRGYFKQGVEAWNQAFVKIGKRDAVRAILPDDKEWPEDYDPDDARYSTISWSIDLTKAYALGLAKVDPRSGQILKSDIIVTSGWVSAWLGDLQQTAPEILKGAPAPSPSPPMASPEAPETPQDFLEEHFPGQPQVKPRNSGAFRYEERTGGASLSAHPSWAMHDPGVRYGSQDDEYEAASVTFDGLSRFLDPDRWEEAIGAGLRSVVMHETGHALGLRHNFKASTGINEDCLRDPICANQKGLSTSVMDYLPPNLLGVENNSAIFSPVIGEYDELAISYGYHEEADDDTLKLYLEKAQSLPVCSDEELSIGSDPFCAAHDLGQNPLVYYRKRLDILSQAQKSLFDHNASIGKSYTAYGASAYNIIATAANIGNVLMSYIGGISTTRLHRGADGSHPNRPAMQVVPVETQREALNLILGVMKTELPALLPPKVARPYLLKRVGTNAVEAINLDGLIRTLQTTLTGELVSLGALQRLQSSDSLSKPWNLGLSVDEYLNTITGVILGDLSLARSRPRSWDMQMALLTGLRETYRTQCSESTLPVSSLASVLIKLKSTHQVATTMLTMKPKTTMLARRGHEKDDKVRVKDDDEVFQHYLMFIENSLGKLDDICSK